MKILVIDDDVTFLAKMEKILSLEDHSIVTASSGGKAIEILNENDFDLILMDLKMPGLSGVDLIRKIREIGCTSIIIVITGYGTIESAVQTTKAGAYDYILKPFEFSALKKKIEAIVFAGLQREFKKEIEVNAQTTEYHRKLAKAIADLAEPIVDAITKEAVVAPGIPVATATGAGSTTGPGKIT